MSIYGYVRVSTVNQKTKRQVDNIRMQFPNAIIREEKQSGKDIEGRVVFRELLSKLKSGDTLVFDEVSRMSRNAEEGYRLYMDLMSRGVNLVFLKERHIDTSEYQKRSQEHLQKFRMENKSVEKLLNGMLELLSEFELDNLKQNIRLAFEQAEHERVFLQQRVTEGKAKSDLPQGRPKGSLNRNTAKGDMIQHVIKEQSKDFEGRFSDAKILREYLSGVSRRTYYKYKKQMKEGSGE